MESKLKMPTLKKKVAEVKTEVKKLRKECLPYEEFLDKRLHKERLKELEKRKVEVSKITAKDKKVFEVAYKILCAQRVKPIKKIKSSKSLKSLKPREGINMCPMFCQKPNTVHEISKSVKTVTVKKGGRCKSAGKKVKPVIVIPPIKTKPWIPPAVGSKSSKIIKKPVVVIPPVKTKPWIPEPRAKPKFRPVIEMPPLTLRKS